MNKMMTREEAIELLRDTPIDIRSTREDDIHTLYATAQMMAIDALRPVSRERVEQVWRGYLQYHGATGTDNLAVVKCSRCGAKIYEITVDLSERKFCLCCGAPLTDEAVDMVMERLEALWCE